MSATTMAANVLELIPETTIDLGSSTLLEPCSCGLALAGHGDAYNEEAFHHFLAIERKRSEASTRPFLLLLVAMDRQAGGTDHMTDAAADRIFTALSMSLRDTDVLGWYREHRIAGAVLTDLGETPQAIEPTHISDRVTRTLSTHLSADLAKRINVRVYQLPARTDSSSADQRKRN